MHNQATPNARANAKLLRRDMTDSERKLWSGLRGEQLGVKFRRQHPPGSYIADFACLDPKLVVELDGSQHLVDARYDARRDDFMRSIGFVVLRFASNEPSANFEGVLQRIVNRLAELTPLAPIPAFLQRGKG